MAGERDNASVGVPRLDGCGMHMLARPLGDPTDAYHEDFPNFRNFFVATLLIVRFAVCTATDDRKLTNQ